VIILKMGTMYLLWHPWNYGTGPPFWRSAILGVRVRVRVRVNPSRPPEWRTRIETTD